MFGAAVVAGWRDDVRSNYQTPTRWGTGINPVHAIVDNTGRDTTPDAHKYTGPPEDITSTDYQSVQQPLINNDAWGNNDQTGLSEIPPLGTPPTKLRSVAPYPAWNRSGRGIRAQVKGSKIVTLAKQIFSLPAYEGPLGKEQGPENQPVVSDPSQYIVQTSMVQRDKSRNGSQMQTGRASKYTQTIGSRYAGMRSPQIDGSTGNSERHAAMVPKVQQTMIRGWWARRAGTGPLPYLTSNEMYSSEAMTREAPPQPSTGPVVTYSGDYLDGDQVWW